MSYFESTNLKDSNGNLINPAKEQTLYIEDPAYSDPNPAVRIVSGSTDDQIVLLRRIVKLLESQAAVDPQQRQRMTVDNISAGVTLPTVTTVTGVTTVSTVTTVSGVTSVTNLAALNGWNQQMFADPARNAYNTGIRERLSFT